MGIQNRRTLPGSPWQLLVLTYGGGSRSGSTVFEAGVVSFALGPLALEVAEELDDDSTALFFK